MWKIFMSTVVIPQIVLKKNPRLRAILQSEFPDISQLSLQQKEQSVFAIKLCIENLISSWSLIQLLSLYGKTTHLESLFAVHAQPVAYIIEKNFLALSCAAVNGHIKPLITLKRF